MDRSFVFAGCDLILVQEKVVQGDSRLYYVTQITEPPSLIVLMHGLTLAQVTNAIVKAKVGSDIAYEGYVISPYDIGKLRVKITVTGIWQQNLPPPGNLATTIQAQYRALFT